MSSVFCIPAHNKRTIIIGQPRYRSQTGNCVVPDDPLATYFNETNHTIGMLAIVQDGGQLTQMCINDNRSAGFSELNSSYCAGGRWVPELRNCPNSEYP